MAINIEFLTQVYFTFDEPVPYKLNKGVVYITPVLLKNRDNFLASVDILNIDKNSYPDVKIIQMSYLQFLCEIMLTDEKSNGLYNQKLGNILALCLNLKKPSIKYVDNRPYIYDELDSTIEINSKNFDEIIKIIMYQNIVHYDGSYINPDLKKAMNDVDELKNKGIDSPSLERQMAIITAHTGLPKREQQEMTYRSHSLLFEEVCGEVEFTTIRPVALFSGSKNELEHWIFKKHKDRFEGYIKDVDSYTNSIGGSQAIKSSNTSMGDSYMQQFNNFKQK